MRHRGLVGGTATITEDDEGGTQGRLPIYIMQTAYIYNKEKKAQQRPR